MPAENGAIQNIISIDQIKNDSVVLKGGGLRKILLVSGIDFELKSDEERDVIVFGYQEFLNSLNFSLQVVIHSRKMNIDGYLKEIDALKGGEVSSLLKNMIDDYRDFVASFVSKNPIMSKTFFVAVPYDPIKIPEAGLAATKKIFGLFGKKKGFGGSLADNQSKIEEGLRQLDLRVDQVVSGLNRIGLRAVPLTEPELVELFYNFYNGR